MANLLEILKHNNSELNSSYIRDKLKIIKKCLNENKISIKNSNPIKTYSTLFYYYLIAINYSPPNYAKNQEQIIENIDLSEVEKIRMIFNKEELPEFKKYSVLCKKLRLKDQNSPIFHKQILDDYFKDINLNDFLLSTVQDNIPDYIDLNFMIYIISLRWIINDFETQGKYLLKLLYMILSSIKIFKEAICSYNKTIEQFNQLIFNQIKDAYIPIGNNVIRIYYTLMTFLFRIYCIHRLSKIMSYFRLDFEYLK